MGWLTAAAVVFSLAGSGYAVRDVAVRRFAPVVMSWAGWAVLLVVAAVASGTGSLAAGAYVGATAAGCAAVAVLGLRIPASEREEPARIAGIRLDVLCLPAAVAGLVLLAVARDPGLAVTVTLVTDAVLFAPTFAHAWKAPGEEAPAAYALFAAGALAAVASAARMPSFTGLAYPVYLALGDTAIVVLILAANPGRHAAPRRRPPARPAAVMAFTVAAGLAAAALWQLTTGGTGIPPADVAQAAVRPSPSPVAPVTVAPVRHRTVLPPVGPSPSPAAAVTPARTPPAPAPAVPAPPQPSPSATYPSPDPRPSPSPTVRPSPSPDPSPTPTPSPSPTVSPTPTYTASPTPSPSYTG